MSTLPIEDLDSFRLRVRDWLAENMPRSIQRPQLPARNSAETMIGEEKIARARWLQRRLYDGGFAGIAYPKAYGGQGLDGAYQRVFSEECSGYETPLWLNMSTLGAQGPTLLDFGTEEQKSEHIPAILRGDEFWCQLLSEPTGGSDLAGVITHAERDGDVWILNGSKIWTSGAQLRDYGICLVRTDWDVPKHKGLTMFMVDLRAPGVTIEPIPLANGVRHFCQEFFDDVVLTDSAVLGEVNEGWTVARRMMVHERNMVGGGSPYAGFARSGESGAARSLLDGLLALASRDDAPVREEARRLVAEAHTLALVRAQLIRRISLGQKHGDLPGAAGSILKLMTSTASIRITEINIQLCGATGAVWRSDDELSDRYANEYLVRQTISIAGGTSEIQRNIISENLLGMPREASHDHGIPFREVLRNRVS
jgi:alkylation response protein AidB-like acyl-CoA dehydrogenase